MRFSRDVRAKNAQYESVICKCWQFLLMETARSWRAWKRINSFASSLPTSSALDTHLWSEYDMSAAWLYYHIRWWSILDLNQWERLCALPQEARSAEVDQIPFCGTDRRIPRTPLLASTQTVIWKMLPSHRAYRWCLGGSHEHSSWLWYWWIH